MGALAVQPVTGPHWHAEVTGLTLRWYPAGSPGFAAHAPFAAVAQLQILAGGRAYIRGHLRRDGQALRPADFRALGQLLRDQFGLRTLLVDRRGQWLEIDLGRA